MSLTQREKECLQKWMTIKDIQKLKTVSMRARAKKWILIPGLSVSQNLKRSF